LATSGLSCGGRKVVPTKQADLVVPTEFVKAFEVKEVDPESKEKKSIRPILPEKISEKSSEKVLKKNN
jgi:hypothetical protein